MHTHPVQQFFFLIILMSANIQEALAQQFTDVTTTMGINVISSSGQQGTGVSFYDIDSDGWDDITFAPNNAPLVIYRNLAGMGFEALSPISNNFETKAPVWIDYDNDGDADLCFTRGQGRTRVFTNNGNWTFTEMPTADFGMTTSLMLRSYGQSWADYDKDGDLDVYICNKTGFNYLGRNNSNGTFTNVTVVAGVGGHPSGPAFQSVWMDYDRDSWPDLFVIYENLPSNAFFPNQLFRNNGDGTFTDVAPTAGLNDLTQTMCISPADYDRDGDQDMYITDVEFEGNQLYTNNGDGTYTDVAPTAGVEVNSFCWGGLWIDPDLDGYDDLHVSTAFTINNNDYFFHNNGDGSFSNTNDLLFQNTENGYATAKGDFNNDGHPDFALTKMSATSSFQLFQATTGPHHFIKVKLEGTHSNRDAIGSWISVHAGGMKHEVYTLAGENYLGQNSQYKLFGLGNATVIDSLTITWPRGLTEKWYSLEADSTYTFIEGQKTQDIFDVPVITILCPGDTAWLDPGEYNQYLWEDGFTERLFGAMSEGLYSVQVEDANGYAFIWRAEVVAGAAPSAEAAISNASCAGEATGSISVTTTPETTIVWEDGSISFERIGLVAGNYAYILTDPEGCSSTDTLFIAEPDPLVLSVLLENETCPGAANGMAQFTAQGGVEPYDFGAQGSNVVLLSPGMYSWEVQDANGCVASVEGEILAAVALVWEVESSNPSCFGGENGALVIVTPPSDVVVNWGDGVTGLQRENLAAGEYTYEINYGIGCTVNGGVTLTDPEPLQTSVSFVNPSCAEGNDGSAEITTTGGTAPYSFSSPFGEWSSLMAGTYSGWITDANGCTVEVVVTLTAPPALSVAPVIQNPVNVDDTGSVQLNPFGGTPPLEVTWSNGSTDSNIEGLAEGSYTYTVTDGNGCELAGEITLIIDNIAESQLGMVKVFPQPARQQFTVSAGFPLFRWKLMELTGRTILTGSANGSVAFEINASGLSGVYIMMVETMSGQWLTSKCIFE
jgi:hypothetical protein